jgi:hypothetical protein
MRSASASAAHGVSAAAGADRGGELEIKIPQVREAAETFASKLFPRTPKLLRTEPLKGLVIGASRAAAGACQSPQLVETTRPASSCPASPHRESARVVWTFASAGSFCRDVASTPAGGRSLPARRERDEIPTAEIVASLKPGEMAT